MRTDEELVAAMANGDKQALKELYQRYFAKLTRFAMQFVTDKNRAEDMVQECFIKLIEQPGHFTTTQKFSTWIYTLVSNKCKNLLRDEANRQILLQKNTQHDYAVTQPKQDALLLKQALSKLFKTLSEKEKQLFVLRFEQQHQVKEIAAILEMPEGSVKSGLFYLLQKINKQLKPLLEDGK